MLKSRSFIVGACILSLAIGYLAGKGGSSSSKEDGADELTQASPQARRISRESRSRSTGDDGLLTSILGGRNLAEVPAADLATLIARLSKYDPGMDPLARAKQSYQLQLLLSKLSSDDLEEVAGIIVSDPDAKRNGGISTILFALAGNDSERALAWVAAQEDSGELFAVVISAIAKDDPIKAGDLLREGLLDGRVDARSVSSAVYSISKSFAELGSTPFLEFVDSQPLRQQSNIILNGMRSMSSDEQIKLLSELQGRFKDGNYTKSTLEYAFSVALGANSEKASAWLESLPEGSEKVQLQLSAAKRLMQNGDKEEAANWFKRAIAASPGKEKEVLIDSVRNMAYNNPEGIAIFASLLPADIRLTVDDLKSHGINALYSSSGGLVSITDALPNPDDKAKLITQSLMTMIGNSKSQQKLMNATDLEILSRRIDAMGLTGDNAESVRNALDAVRNYQPAPKE